MFPVWLHREGIPGNQAIITFFLHLRSGFTPAKGRAVQLFGKTLTFLSRLSSVIPDLLRNLLPRSAKREIPGRARNDGNILHFSFFIPELCSGLRRIIIKIQSIIIPTLDYQTFAKSENHHFTIFPNPLFSKFVQQAEGVENHHPDQQKHLS